MNRAKLLAVGLAMAAPLASLGAQSGDPTIERELELFGRKSGAEQKRLVIVLGEALGDVTGDYFAAVADLAAASATPGAPRTAPQRARKPSKSAPKNLPAAGWELPSTVGYAFGLGIIAAVPGKRAVLERAALRVPVELSLMGMLPETDRAVAELERRLDSDQTADDFAAFLTSWRNGDESFYEALDRTAGTPSSVFFYDVMLGDFVGKIVDDDEPDGAKLKKSLTAAHDALHAAFLSYRQYRAFREAVALSLVLPPDVALPMRLARYEQPVAEGYSLRQQVLMVLATCDFDPRVVVERVRASAEPMPKPLWSVVYEPSHSWNELFAAAMPAMVEAAGDTDTFLLRAVAERRQQAATVVEGARQALGLDKKRARN